MNVRVGARTCPFSSSPKLQHRHVQRLIAKLHLSLIHSAVAGSFLHPSCSPSANIYRSTSHFQRCTNRMVRPTRQQLPYPLPPAQRLVTLEHHVQSDRPWRPHSHDRTDGHWDRTGDRCGCNHNSERAPDSVRASSATRAVGAHRDGSNQDRIGRSRHRSRGGKRGVRARHQEAALAVISPTNPHDSGTTPKLTRLLSDKPEAPRAARAGGSQADLAAEYPKGWRVKAAHKFVRSIGALCAAKRSTQRRQKTTLCSLPRSCRLRA